MSNLIKKETTIYEMLVNKASKVDIIKAFAGISMKQVIVEKPITVGEIIRHYGEENATKAVVVLFADLSTSFGSDLKKDHLLELSAEVQSSLYKNLSLEDLYIICNRVKTSDIYGKLTVNKVLKEVKNYFDEKLNEVDNYNYNKHLETKSYQARQSSTTITELVKRYQANETYRKTKKPK